MDRQVPIVLRSKNHVQGRFFGPNEYEPVYRVLGGLARAAIVPAVFRVSRSRSVFVRLFESSELLLFPPTWV